MSRTKTRFIVKRNYSDTRNLEDVLVSMIMKESKNNISRNEIVKTQNDLVKTKETEYTKDRKEAVSVSETFKEETV